MVAAPTYVFSKNEKANMFESAYKKKFGNTPTFDAAFAYDAVGILANALIEAKGDVEKAQKMLTTKGNFDGIMGQIKIDSEGGSEVPMGLGIIKAGQIMPM